MNTSALVQVMIIDTNIYNGEYVYQIDNDYKCVYILIYSTIIGMFIKNYVLSEY